MATTLYLLDSVPDTHLGTDSTRGTAASVGVPWTSRALGTSRGSGVVASDNTATITAAGTAAYTEILVGGVRPEWISPPVSADVTISGTITANIWASESSMSANVAINVIIEILRANTTTTRNSNTQVTIITSLYVTEAAVTTRAVNNFTTGMTSGAYSSQTLNRGDRLRIRVIGAAVGAMAAGFTFNASWNGTSAAADGDSYVSFTENFSFESAAGTISVARGGDGNVANVAANEMSAAGFTATGNLDAVSAWLSKTGSPTDDLVVEVQTASGSNPSGSVVSTIATIAGTSLTTTATQTTWSSLGISLTPGAVYFIVFRRSSTLDASNYYRIGQSLSDVSSALSYRTLSSGVWGSGGPLDLALSVTTLTSTLYLTDTASDVSTASNDKTAWTSRGSGVVTSVTNTAAGWTAPIQATDTAGGTVIDWFTPQLAAFTLTGMAQANIRALESNASANASLRCEIAKVSSTGTSPTVWASWCCAPTGTDNGELTTSEVARTINVSGDDLAFSDGERIRIRLYNDDISSAAMGASQTVTRYYSGTSGGASGDSYITLAQTVTALGGGTTYTKVGYGRESA